MRTIKACSTVFAVLVVSGCAAAASAAGHSSSPWEVGGGIRGGALYPFGTNGFSAGPMASYTYLRWNGGGGHDNLFELTGQLRKSFGFGELTPWVSTEAGFAHMKSVSGDFDASDSGWSAWIHAGVPVAGRIAVFAGGGITGLWDTNGKNVRAGLEMRR